MLRECFRCWSQSHFWRNVLAKNFPKIFGIFLWKLARDVGFLLHVLGTRAKADARVSFHTLFQDDGRTGEDSGRARLQRGGDPKQLPGPGVLAHLPLGTGRHCQRHPGPHRLLRLYILRAFGVGAGMLDGD